MQTKFKLMAVALMAMVMAGCAGDPEILPATKREPSDPAKVKFYKDAPAKYEKLGTIALPVAPDANWDDRGNANAGFKRFQQQAAALGANGVLLKAEPGETNVNVGAGFNNEMYHVPMKVDGDKRTAIGQAIFVVEE